MQEVLKTGWLENTKGEKFAPKTLTSQVVTNDGVQLDNKIESDLLSMKQEVNDYTDNKVNEAISNLEITDLDSHINDDNIHITDEERASWNDAKTHASSKHAPNDAEKNTIVGIQQNGKDLSVDSSTRKVNITTPTKTSELVNDSGFITETANALNTARGENIYVNNSSNGKLAEFHLFGKAKQNTTQGNQLANLPDAEEYYVSGVNWSCKNGVVKAVGTSYAISPSSIGVINYEIPIESGDYFVSGSSDGATVYVSVKDCDGNVSYYNDKSFTLLGNEQSVKLYCQISSGVTVNTTIYPMLNKGTEPLPWESYTGGQPSPNPKYPQEIEVPSGDVVVKSLGKQLAKLPDVGEKTFNGITWSCKNGVVKANGISTDYSYTNADQVGIMHTLQLEAGTYFVSGSMGDVIVYVEVTDSNGIKRHYYSNSFELKDDEQSVRFYCQVHPNKTVDATVYPMLNKGTEPLPWEPYKETTATIPVTDFAGIPVESGGNYTDSNGQQWICDEVIKYADGSGEKIQRIKKKVIKGSNDGYWDIQNDRYFILHGSEDGFERPINPRFISNVGSVTYNVLDNGGYGFAYAYGYRVRFENMNPENNTLDDLKTYLKENPITTYAVLKEPIHTPLTAEEIAEIEKLHTFNPVTNISNGADCGMSVTYFTNSLDGEFTSDLYEKNHIHSNKDVLDKLTQEHLDKIDNLENTINDSDFVTTNTEQTITANKTFSSNVSVGEKISANEVMVGDKVTLRFNTSTESLDFIFN